MLNIRQILLKVIIECKKFDIGRKEKNKEYFTLFETDRTEFVADL
jgi:hypothetical protein